MTVISRAKSTHNERFGHLGSLGRSKCTLGCLVLHHMSTCLLSTATSSRHGEVGFCLTSDLVRSARVAALKMIGGVPGATCGRIRDRRDWLLRDARGTMTNYRTTTTLATRLELVFKMDPVTSLTYIVGNYIQTSSFNSGFNSGLQNTRRTTHHLN